MSLTVAAARVSWADRAAYALLALLAALVCVSLFNAYAFDDSYIGYSIAQNLSEGHGFFFNAGERTLSTSAPLAVWLYAFAHRFLHADIVLTAQWLSTVAYFALVLGAYALARHIASPIGAFMAAVVLGSSPFTLLLWSHESLLSLSLLVVAALLLALPNGRVPSALVLGMATLMRPEALVAIAVLSILLWRREGLKSAAAYGATAVAPYVMWAAAASVYFGTFVSTSEAVKHAVLLYHGFEPYFDGVAHAILLGYGPSFGRAAVWLMAALVAALWIYAGVRRQIRAVHLAVVAWVFGLTVLYLIAQVPFFMWFGVQVAILTAASTCLAWPAQRADGRLQVGPGRFVQLAMQMDSLAIFAASLVFAIGLLTNSGTLYSFRNLVVAADFRHSVLHTLGAWLRANTSPADTVEFNEIGQIRYYSGRTIIDFQGLTSRDVIDHVVAGDAIWSFKRYKPRIFIYNAWISGFVDPLEYDWFQAAYSRADHIVIPGDAGRSDFTIYRLAKPEFVPAADERDLRPRMDLIARDHGGNLKVVFAPGHVRFDGVEIRTRLAAPCVARLSVRRSDGLLVARKVSELSPAPFTRIVRASVYFTPVAGAAEQSYSFVLEGCPSAVPAPPRLLLAKPILLAMPPWTYGSVADAVTVYWRQ